MKLGNDGVVHVPWLEKESCKEWNEGLYYLNYG
jgi:hypothetical protein